MKYRIMFDYGAYEGFKLQNEEFYTIDEAVQHAVALNYTTPFIIVEIHWKPKLLKNEN